MGGQSQISDIWPDSDNPLRLKIRDCSLTWKTEVSSYHKPGQPIFIRAVRDRWEPSDLISKLNGTIVIEKTSTDSLDDCDVTVVVAPGTFLPSLELEIENSKILTSTISGLSTFGQVYISGERVELSVIDSIANYFNVSITTGLGIFNPITYANPSVFYGKFADFDIVTAQPVSALISQAFGAACLYAEYTEGLGNSSSPFCSLLTPGTNISDPVYENCTQSFLLCSNSQMDAGLCNVSLPETSVIISGGQLTFTASDNLFSFPLLSYQFGLTSTDFIFFDGSLTGASNSSSLSTVSTWFNAEVGWDSIAILDVYIPQAQDRMWLYSSSRAYLELQPYWLSTFSASILSPRIERFTTRLLSGICMRPGTSVENAAQLSLMGKLSDTLRVALAATSSQVVASRGRYHIVEYNLRTDGSGLYTSTKIELRNNPSLLAAVVISFIIAFVFALSGVAGGYFVFQSVAMQLYREQTIASRAKDLKQKFIKLGSEGRFRKEYIEEDEVKIVLPHPFNAPNVAYTLYKQATLSTLASFLDDAGRELFNGRDGIPLSEFQTAYEDYCIPRLFLELPVLENESVLKSRGYFISNVNDITTTIYRKMLLIDQEIVSGSGRANSPLGAGETTLQYFIRLRCTITSHDVDFIFVEAFKQEYVRFCKAENLEPIPVVSSTMAAQFQVIEDRVNVHYINRVPVLKEIETEGRKCCRRSSGELVWGFYVTFAHLCGIAFLPAVPLIVALFFQTQMDDSTAYPSDLHLSADDLLFHPWNLSSKFSKFLLQNQIIIFVTVCMWIFSLVELILFYIEYVPKDLAVLLTQGRPAYNELLTCGARLRHRFQTFFYILFAYQCACMLGYFALVLCWCLLGAMLNPEAFLPYATAAASFIAFAIGKYKRLSNFRSEVTEIVSNFVLRNIKHMISQSNIAGLGMDVESVVNDAVSGNLKSAVLSMAASKMRALLYKTPMLGELANKLNIDPETLALLVSGDKEVVFKLGRQWGIDEAIMRLFVGLGRSDEIAVSQAICDLSTKQGVNIHPDLALAVLQLSSTQLEKAGQGTRGIKQAMNSVLASNPDMLHRHMLGRDLMPGEPSLSDLSSASAHLLNVFDGLLNIGDCKLGPLVDILLLSEEMSERKSEIELPAVEGKFGSEELQAAENVEPIRVQTSLTKSRSALDLLARSCQEIPSIVTSLLRLSTTFDDQETDPEEFRIAISHLSEDLLQVPEAITNTLITVLDSKAEAHEQMITILNLRAPVLFKLHLALVAANLVTVRHVMDNSTFEEECQRYLGLPSSRVCALILNGRSMTTDPLEVALSLLPSVTLTQKIMPSLNLYSLSKSAQHSLGDLAGSFLQDALRSLCPSESPLIIALVLLQRQRFNSFAHRIDICIQFENFLVELTSQEIVGTKISRYLTSDASSNASAKSDVNLRPLFLKPATRVPTEISEVLQLPISREVKDDGVKRRLLMMLEAFQNGLPGTFKFQSAEEKIRLGKDSSLKTLLDWVKKINLLGDALSTLHGACLTALESKSLDVKSSSTVNKAEETSSQLHSKTERKVVKTNFDSTNKRVAKKQARGEKEKPQEDPNKKSAVQFTAPNAVLQALFRNLHTLANEFIERFLPTANARRLVMVCGTLSGSLEAVVRLMEMSLEKTPENTEFLQKLVGALEQDLTRVNKQRRNLRSLVSEVYLLDDASGRLLTSLNRGSAAEMRNFTRSRLAASSIQEFFKCSLKEQNILETADINKLSQEPSGKRFLALLAELVKIASSLLPSAQVISSALLKIVGRAIDSTDAKTNMLLDECQLIRDCFLGNLKK